MKTTAIFENRTVLVCNRYQRGEGLVTVLALSDDHRNPAERLYQVRDHADGGEWPVLGSALCRLRRGDLERFLTPHPALSASRKQATLKSWGRIAGEALLVDFYAEGHAYAWGTEAGCRKLAASFDVHGAAGHTADGRWYFYLPLPLLADPAAVAAVAAREAQLREAAEQHYRAAVAQEQAEHRATRRA